MLYNFNLPAYTQAIQDSESSGNYSANNGIAFGAYQFTQDTLNYLQQKYNLPILSQFDNSTKNLQDEYFSYFVSDILDFIQKNSLDFYLGTTITGANKYPYSVPANIYGLVAGAHLGGETGLKNFLTLGIDHDDSPHHDGTGTFISDYIAKFSDELSNNMVVSDSKKKSIITRYRRNYNFGLK